MAIYYVDTSTGNDSNNGLSEGSAKATIQSAVNLATTAGDIVYVKSGDYTSESFNSAAAGTSENPIKIVGYNSIIGDISASSGPT